MGGGGLLIYLGIKLFRSASDASLGNVEEASGKGTLQIFGHATAVTALNPKSIVFFIAFVPQFISVERPLWPQFVILTVTFVTLAALNALAWALLGDKMRVFFKRPGALAWFSRFGGGAVMAMGVATVAMKRA